MNSDVKSTNLSASGTVFGGPARVKGIYIVPGATAGTVVIKDGGASGTTVCTLDTIASATGTPVHVPIPGNGIKCDTDIYCALTNAAKATVFYG